MKRIFQAVAAFCAALLLLTQTAFANSAPPEYLLAVKLANPPEEPYYLDILVEGKADGSSRLSNSGPVDQKLLEILRHAVPEGWKACSLSWSNSLRVEGDLAGENGIHRFSGLDTPKKFRILIATESGETWVSDIRERRVVQDSVTVDWDRKTVSATPVWLAAILQTLSTLLPTLAIEGLLLLVFRFDWKKNWKPFLQINLITQGALTLFLSINIIGSRNIYSAVLWDSLFLFPIELVIAFTEAYLYTRRFAGHSEGRAFAYGITANAASYILGLALVQPVWEGFARVLWLGI